MLLKRQIWVIFSLMTSVASSSQVAKCAITHVDSIEVLKCILRKDNIVSTQTGGNWLSLIKPWHSFVLLLKLANTENLLQLVGDTSPCIRLYGYIGLVHNKYSSIADIRAKLERDTGKLTSISECLVSETTVGKGIHSIQMWYQETSVTSTLALFRKDPSYFEQVFSDVVNNRRIKSYDWSYPH
jgi:hypothetical protein